MAQRGPPRGVGAPSVPQLRLQVAGVRADEPHQQHTLQHLGAPGGGSRGLLHGQVRAVLPAAEGGAEPGLEHQGETEALVTMASRRRLSSSLS